MWDLPASRTLGNTARPGNQDETRRPAPLIVSVPSNHRATTALQRACQRGTAVFSLHQMPVKPLQPKRPEPPRTACSDRTVVAQPIGWNDHSHRSDSAQNHGRIPHTPGSIGPQGFPRLFVKARTSERNRTADANGDHRHGCSFRPDATHAHLSCIPGIENEML